MYRGLFWSFIKFVWKLIAPWCFFFWTRLVLKRKLSARTQHLVGKYFILMWNWEVWKLLSVKLPHVKAMANIASAHSPQKNRKTAKVVTLGTKAEPVMKQAKNKQLMVSASFRPILWFSYRKAVMMFNRHRNLLRLTCRRCMIELCQLRTFQPWTWRPPYFVGVHYRRLNRTRW